ncbi:MAG: Gfo/Idh/MocA family protein, partial [bacterium]
ICTPNDSHMEIALACIKHGKMILCEKPLALDGKQGEAMVKAVEKAKLPNLVWYNYRFLPAVTLAKNIVDAGELGKVFHYRANFLQDWTISADLPQGGTGLWRLDAKVAGSGVTGDLLAHCIDTARWINGDIVAVSAMTETFIKERVHTATGKKQPVKIDDACAFLARFENGSMAVFESTRYARGHKALYTFEINGANKSLAWDLHDLNRLSYFDHGVPGDRRGWSSIHCTDGDHPYAGKWWVPGLCLGYEQSFTHGLYEFITSLDAPNAEKRFPDFRHALGTQYVCDAVLEAARTGKWTKVKRA